MLGHRVHTGTERQAQLPDVQLQEYDSYSSCVEALRNDRVDALTTDEVILAGYAHFFPKSDLRVLSMTYPRDTCSPKGDFIPAGRPFSTERYGIRMAKGQPDSVAAGQRGAAGDARPRAGKPSVWEEALRNAIGNEMVDAMIARAAAPIPSSASSRCRVISFLDSKATPCPEGWRREHTVGRHVARPVAGVLDDVETDVLLGDRRVDLGVALAGMRVSPVPVMRWFAVGYVNIVRNTPLHAARLVRLAGPLHQPRDSAGGQGPRFRRQQQLPAGSSLPSSSTPRRSSARRCARASTPCRSARPRPPGPSGSDSQVFGMIVLPQAMRAVIAPMGSVLIALTKNTTVASIIGVSEAALLMKTQIENHANVILGIFAIIAVCFMIITLSEGLRLRLVGQTIRGEAMSGESSVLYDAPVLGQNPQRDRRRGLHRHPRLIVAWVIVRLARNEQFDADMWTPFLKGLDVDDLHPPRPGRHPQGGVRLDPGRALVLGALLGIGRLSDHRAVRWFCGAFTEGFRAIPVLLLILFTYYYYAQYGIVPPSQLAFAAVVTGLTLYNGTVIAEILRWHQLAAEGPVRRRGPPWACASRS